MRKITLSVTSLMIMSIGVYAKGDIVDLAPNNNFLKMVNGYIRLGYQQDNNNNDDLALGGKLHLHTNSWYGLSAGASFYTTNHLGEHDGAAVPFFDANNDSYSILGEAYIQGQWENTILKAGRQELDTPFADTDDIGMVPNTFEAYTLINKDFKDTTIFLAQIQKMAGVDADVVDKFTPINGSDNMQLIGITYEGIENLTLDGWYYYLKNGQIDNIGYLEANYEGSINGMGYGFGVQYAKENYKDEDDATVYGISANINFESLGIALSSAYNKANDNSAFSGFGGGPFFTSSEYLIIDNAGRDGSQTKFALEYDASNIGADGLTVGLSKVILENEANKTSTEVDFTASYEVSKNMKIDLIYSDIDGKNIGEDSSKQLRVFANYSF